MAHGLKDREGQIPTPYPSSPFAVPQCKFARRAITLNSDDDSRGHDASLQQAACQNSRGQRAMRWGWVCHRPPPTFLARCVHRQPACAHYFALCLHVLRTSGRVLPPLRLAADPPDRNYSCGQVTTLPCAKAWCAGNQCCCRHRGSLRADVMGGGAGAVGAAPDVRHQPPGYTNLY